MKTIEEAVIELGGKLPNKHSTKRQNKNGWYISANNTLAHINECVWFNPKEFESCAKRLGYINGYRWGVEYPTNGKRPELEDDVLVELRYLEDGIWFDKTVGDSRWLVGCVVSFRIIDPRYKPDDTSYLNAQTQYHIVGANEMVSDWWDYDKLQVKSGKLIPVDSEVLFFDRTPNHFKCKVMYSSEYVTVIRCIDGSVNNEMIGVDISRCPFEENFNQIKPLDWNRKSELEREKVIEAAESIALQAAEQKLGYKIEYKDGLTESLSALYDLGMLVLPPKKSDTKD